MLKRIVQCWLKFRRIIVALAGTGRGARHPAD